MTKYSKVNGKYLIKGKSYEMLTGSRAQVYHGTAYKTSGDLTKSDLVQNKHGRIVSASKYKLSKQKGKNNLFNKGYTARKGKFGAVRNGVSISHKRTHRHRSRRHRHMRGGSDTSAATTTTTATSHDAGVDNTGGASAHSSPSTFQPSETRSLLADMAGQIGGRGRSRSRASSMSRSRSRSRSLARSGGNPKHLFLG